MKISDYLKKQLRPYNPLFSILAYFVFALIYTYPLILHINKLIIGDLEGDMWKHLWGFWWVKKRIFEDGVIPIFTSILNYPYGGSLFFIDPLGALLSIPLQFIMPITLVYNILVIFNLILGAFGGYLLCNYFVKNRQASFYAGAAFSFTAYMLAYITSGVSETFNYGWIPIFLYFYARTLRENNDLMAVSAGTAIFFVALGSFYYGSFATIFGIIFFLFFVVQEYGRYNIRIDRKKETAGVYANPVMTEALTQTAGTLSGLIPDESRSTVRRNNPNFLDGIRSFLIRIRGRKAKKVLTFRQWILNLFSYVAVSLFAFTLGILLFAIPYYRFNPDVNLNTFWWITSLLMVILTASAIYTGVFYSSSLKNFTSYLQSLIFSNNPRHIKARMFTTYALYSLAFLGFIHLRSVMRQDTGPAIYRVGILSAGFLITALILSYMQIRGEDTFIRRKRPGKSNSSKNTINFIEYGKILLPWFALLLATVNMLRVAVFYQEIVRVFGPQGTLLNTALSLVVFIGSAIYIIVSRIYLKWELFSQLYIDPPTPENVDTPTEKAKIIKRNIIITTILALSFSLPPFILYFQGFSPQVFMKVWVLFTLALAVTGITIFLLSFGSKKPIFADSENDTKIMGFLKLMFKGPLRRLIIMCIIAIVLIGPVFYTFKVSLNVSQGLVKRERSLEFIDLYLSQRFHNVSKLSDYVTMGKSRLVRTYTVDRLTRSSYAGWITLILAFSSLILARKRKYYWYWIFCAIFFTMFSLGPYLYVTDKIHLGFRFPIYILFYKYFPFFNQISIPYRFNICAMLSIAVLAGYALSQLFRRFPRNQQSIMTTILGLGMLFEVCILSPAPYPMALSNLDVPEFYREIARDTDEYGIIDSPIQRIKGELLPGEYFYYQMIHNKGIPYKVEGTIPVYIYENQFTVYLFNLEKGYSVSPPNEALLKQYFLELKKNKFKYIVVHNNYLKKSSRERVHTYLRHFMGKPRITDDGLYIYKVY